MDMMAYRTAVSAQVGNSAIRCLFTLNKARHVQGIAASLPLGIIQSASQIWSSAHCWRSNRAAREVSACILSLHFACFADVTP